MPDQPGQLGQPGQPAQSDNATGVLVIIVALCATFVLRIGWLAIPLLVSIIDWSPPRLIHALLSADFVVRFGLLVGMGLLSRGKGRAAVVARGAAIAVGASLLFHAVGPMLGMQRFMVLVGIASAIACWITLATLSAEHGQAILPIVRAAFFVALTLQVAANIAFQSIDATHRAQLALFGNVVGVVALVQPASLLALAFPLQSKS